MRMLFKNIADLGDYGQESVFNFPIQLTENDEQIILRALAPGMRQEDLEITISGQKLYLSGIIPCRTGNYLQQECPCGKFSRVLDLGCTIDASSAQARLEAGVLTLLITKNTNAKTRRIPVKYEG